MLDVAPSPSTGKTRPTPTHGPTIPVAHTQSEADEIENLYVALFNKGATG